MLVLYYPAYIAFTKLHADYQHRKRHGNVSYQCDAVKEHRRQMKPGKQHDYADDRYNCRRIAERLEKPFKIKLSAACVQVKDEGTRWVHVKSEADILKYHQVENIASEYSVGDRKAHETAVYSGKGHHINAQVLGRFDADYFFT